MFSRIPLYLLIAFAPHAFAQPGSISGFVVDTTGSSIPRASVKLAPDRETTSGANGEFSFADATPGPFRLTFAAKGFAAKTIEGELKPAETLSLPPTELVIDTLNTELNVTQTQVELAEAQIKVQEQQRLIGILPNFFAAYDPDAVPLNAHQKLELTAKTWFDPSAFVIEGIIAGVGQARNTHKGFGQGAQGYAKRYGAGFADYGTALLLEKVVMPTIFKQDPRYFYKGTGTKSSRARYAISRTFVCRGDNKKDQFCYSGFLTRFGTGFITNYYFPAADRDSTSTILQNAALSIGFDALGNLFQEFVARKITRKHP